MLSFNLDRDKVFKIGVISDTHGLYRTEINNVFKGVNLIIHAGDIGKPELIKSLEEFAPVVAVRGNVDIEEWCSRYPAYEEIDINGINIFVVHDVSDFDHNQNNKCKIVVFGHSHKPFIKQWNDTIFFNPGSAGPQRFSLPISAGLILINDGKIETHHVGLK